MIKKITEWFERVLEKPFYEAEIIRSEILLGNSRKSNVHVSRKFPLKLKQV